MGPVKWLIKRGNYMENCDLCNLIAGNVITKKYYENDNWIIVDCKSCKVPMLVSKVHTSYTHLTLIDLEELFRGYKGDKWFIPVNHSDYYVDCRMRKIPEHFHCHYRKR